MEPLPVQFARRGFSVPAAPATDWSSSKADVPGFLYKDYSLPLWYLLKDYVLSVLETEPRFAATKSEKEKTDAMKSDPEITAWFGELFDEDAANLPLRGRPDPRKTYTDFVEFLTQLIFQGSAQHAAVNFPQYEHLSFQPARPLGLQRAMPRNSSELTEKFILESLVDNQGISLLLTTYDILSTCCTNTLMLNESTSNANLLDGGVTIKPSFPTLWKSLMKKMSALEELEVARNTKEDFHYPYLYPSRVPQSIAI